MNAKFQVLKITKNVSANGKKILGSFYSDSRTRFNFAQGEKKADMIFSAIEPDYYHVAAVFASMPFANAEHIIDIDFTNVDLDVYDILRRYDDKDAELKDVTRTAYSTATEYGAFNVRVIGEFWKTDRRGNSKKRGERIEYWYDDERDDALTLDLAIDAKGHIAPKQYGIGAAWALAKSVLDEHATSLAMDARVRTHKYTHVDLILQRVASGNSTQRTQR